MMWRKEQIDPIFYLSGALRGDLDFNSGTDVSGDEHSSLSSSDQQHTGLIVVLGRAWFNWMKDAKCHVIPDPLQTTTAWQTERVSVRSDLGKGLHDCLKSTRVIYIAMTQQQAIQSPAI